MVRLVLFDFDGTLADTAPDLAAAANLQRLARGMPALPYEALRPVASQGARGLLRVALGLSPEDVEYPDVRDKFLEDYAASMDAQSRLFDGVPELLAAIEAHGMQWGIVTNKVAWLAEPLIGRLGLAPAVTVCGDTTPHPKPHPAPLLHAARELDTYPAHAVYVGDDQRDIEAGRAAGMPTIAAAWGYCGDASPVHTWEADHVAASPAETWPAIQALLARRDQGA